MQPLTATMAPHKKPQRKQTMKAETPERGDQQAPEEALSEDVPGEAAPVLDGPQAPPAELLPDQPDGPHDDAAAAAASASISWKPQLNLPDPVLQAAAREKPVPGQSSEEEEQSEGAIGATEQAVAAAVLAAQKALEAERIQTKCLEVDKDRLETQNNDLAAKVEHLLKTVSEQGIAAAKSRKQLEEFQKLYLEQRGEDPWHDAACRRHPEWAPKKAPAEQAPEGPGEYHFGESPSPAAGAASSTRPSEAQRSPEPWAFQTPRKPKTVPGEPPQRVEKHEYTAEEWDAWKKASWHGHT